MQTIDQSKLSRYLEQNIDHDDNPESFRYQMQSQISKYLKMQQQRAKQAQSKMRVEHIIEEQNNKRSQLMQRLQAKAKKGIDIKTKKLQDRTQSLVDLHRRRELMQTEKVKQNRKQQLLKSLKKIEQFESKREAAINFRLNKSANIPNSHSASRLTIRDESNSAKYDALVHQLQKKGVFAMPSRQLNALYQKKAKNFRASACKQEDKRDDMLGVSLSKIENARQRKEKLLLERSKRLQDIEKYQQELKKGKLKEIEQQEKKKRKSLQAKQALKILKAQSAMSTSRQTTAKQGEPVEIEIGQEMVRVKNPSYRDQIRKHIEHFLITKKN